MHDSGHLCHHNYHQRHNLIPHTWNLFRACCWHAGVEEWDSLPRGSHSPTKMGQRNAHVWIMEAGLDSGHIVEEVGTDMRDNNWFG